MTSHLVQAVLELLILLPLLPQSWIQECASTPGRIFNNFYSRYLNTGLRLQGVGFSVHSLSLHGYITLDDLDLQIQNRCSWTEKLSVRHTYVKCLASSRQIQ